MLDSSLSKTGLAIKGWQQTRALHAEAITAAPACMHMCPDGSISHFRNHHGLMGLRCWCLIINGAQVSGERQLRRMLISQGGNINIYLTYVPVIILKSCYSSFRRTVYCCILDQI